MRQATDVYSQLDACQMWIRAAAVKKYGGGVEGGNATPIHSLLGTSDLSWAM